MLIYDIEIIKAIPPRNGELIEGIKYCEGWHDHANMGISCICAYDYFEDKYRVFTESNKSVFSDLIKNRGIYIGFNNINFDNKVIEASWGIKISNFNCFDILRQIWKAAGYDENVFNFDTHTGYDLDACCKANFGTQKSGYGGYAPVEWQQGKIGDVIDYCLNDIKLTKQLFDKIQNDNWIIDPKDNSKKLYIGKIGRVLNVTGQK